MLVIPRTHRIIAQSAVAASHTGDTNETALATIAIPANAMGLNGRLSGQLSWALTSTANGKTLRVRFGASGAGLSGTQIMAVTNVTSLASVTFLFSFANRGSASSQVGSVPVSSNTGLGGSGALGMPTAAIDTTAASEIVISGALANSGETITLESYYVELMIP